MPARKKRITNHMTLNNIRNFAIALVLAVSLAFVAPQVDAQTTLSSTTLSAGITAGQLTVPLTSGTGVQAFANAGPAQGGIGSPITQASYMMYVDKEAIIVNSISGNTVTRARRGAQGTAAVPHNSGARVFFGPSTAFTTFDQSGSCTNVLNNANQYLPKFNTTSGNGFYCMNIAQSGAAVGQWVLSNIGTMASGPGSRWSFFCTGTAGSAETEYLNGAACSGATTATVGQQTVANTGTIYNLRVTSSAAFTGGTGKDVITIGKNGTDTTLTCTAVAAATVCSDTTHGFQVVAGDIIRVKLVTATSDTAANVAVSFDQR